MKRLQNGRHSKRCLLPKSPGEMVALDSDNGNWLGAESALQAAEGALTKVSLGPATGGHQPPLLAQELLTPLATCLRRRQLHMAANDTLPSS